MFVSNAANRCNATGIAEQLALILQENDPECGAGWKVFDHQLVERALEEHHWPKALANKMPEGIHGISCHFLCPDPVLLSNPSTAIHLYRIAQEAVQNAIKHGKPERVAIHLAKADHAIRLAVTDDGNGLSRTFAKSTGMGLKIMEYRAKTIGAILELRRGEQRGTVLSCLLPAVPLNLEGSAT